MEDQEKIQINIRMERDLIAAAKKEAKRRRKSSVFGRKYSVVDTPSGLAPDNPTKGKSRRASKSEAAARARWASWREASTNCGSFMVTNAWSGVLVRSRRTQKTSLVGALRISIAG